MVHGPKCAVMGVFSQTFSIHIHCFGLTFRVYRELVPRKGVIEIDPDLLV